MGPQVQRMLARPRGGDRRRYAAAVGPVPVALDTDIGGDIDDALAVAFCALHPGVDLRCVTTVNGDTDRRGRLARALLDLLGRQDVPVGAGASVGLSGVDNASMPAGLNHGADLIDATGLGAAAQGAKRAAVRLHDPLTVVGLVAPEVEVAQVRHLAVVGSPGRVATFESTHGRPVTACRRADAALLRGALVETLRSGPSHAA